MKEMELNALHEFQVNGDKQYAKIKLGFNKDWKFTKKIEIYDYDDNLLSKTKWATVKNTFLPEERRTKDQLMDFFGKMENHSKEHLKKMLERIKKREEKRGTG